MKNLILVFLGLCFMFSVKAQDLLKSNNNLRTEAGYIFSGDNDLQGISVYSEFQRYFGNRIKGAVGIGSYHFDGKTDGKLADGDVQILDAGAFVTGISGYWEAVKTNRIDLELGVGGFLNFWDKTSVLIRPESTTETNVNYLDDSDKYLSFAPSVSLALVFHFSQTVSINARGFYQQGIESDSMPVLGIGCGMNISW